MNPVQNARQEAYLMRVEGRNYNTNAADRALKGIDAKTALHNMIVPEVIVIYFLRIIIIIICYVLSVTIIVNIIIIILFSYYWVF